jgi:hypothetical protein
MTEIRELMSRYLRIAQTVTSERFYVYTVSMLSGVNICWAQFTVQLLMANFSIRGAA